MQRLISNPVDDLFLKPGEFWFGKAPARLLTILGSCITITLWHRQRRIGGMCHYMLPQADLRHPLRGYGRTAGEAMALFLSSVRSHHTAPAEYEVKVFGGASFLAGAQTVALASQVAAQNVAAARRLLKENGFSILREHVGGHASRKLVFDLSTGDAWLNLSPAVPGLS